jgi:general secretion pathway protein J
MARASLTPRALGRPSRRRESGMTLVEAMIAIAILTIVMTMVYGGFSQTMRNRAIMEEGMDRAHVVRVAMERMAREISQAFVSIHLNPNATLVTMRTVFHGRHEGEGSRLDFTSFSHRRLFRDAHESDQNELGYFLTHHRNEDGDDTVALVRRESRRIDDAPEEGGQLTIMIDDVRELSFRFLDPQSQQWVDDWDTNGLETNRLPAQVMIRLVVPALGDHDDDEVYATRTWIPITWALNHAVYSP